jgi:hypothetical protein
MEDFTHKLLKIIKMKKIILALVILINISAYAQSGPCSNCNQQKQQVPAQPVFMPTIFTPAPIGGVSHGIAYLYDVPVNSSTHLVAYIFMVGEDGQLVKMAVSGDIYPRPAYWPGEFFHDYTTTYAKDGSETYKYINPKPIAMTFQVKVMRNANNQVATNADGSPMVQQVITFSF